VTPLSAASCKTESSNSEICLDTRFRDLEDFALYGSMARSSEVDPLLPLRRLLGIFPAGLKKLLEMEEFPSPPSEDSDSRSFPRRYFRISRVPRCKISKRIPRIGFPSKVNDFKDEIRAN